MSRGPVQQISAFGAAILLVTGLPVGVRLIWLEFGPPVVNLAADPQREYRRLDIELEDDRIRLAQISGRLRRLGVMKNPCLQTVVSFFCGPNSSRYSECFLEVARQHLKEPEVARQALLKAICLDHGLPGRQAAGIFVARFSDDISATEVAAELTRYDRKFARQQLNNMSNETHTGLVHAFVLTALARLCREEGKQQESKNFLEKAAQEISALEPSALKTEMQERLAAENSRTTDSTPATTASSDRSVSGLARMIEELAGGKD
jgi:hypothetical protein